MTLEEKTMEIQLPNMEIQKSVVYEMATREAIAQLQTNLLAPKLPPQSEIAEWSYPSDHLLRENEGWSPPHADIVGSYFRHFQHHFPEYGTDKKLALLLGLSSDRRIRDFKAGSTNVPYGIWRKFLVITGRVPQDIIKVIAFMG